MPSPYAYPTNFEMEEINRDLMPRLREGRVFLDLFPEEYEDTSHVIWEQRDNIVGLMQGRGYNNPPSAVAALGSKIYDMLPSVLGDFVPLDEQMLTERRQVGNASEAVPIYDLVGDATTQLIVRQYDLIEFVLSQILVTGQYQIFRRKTLIGTDTLPIPTYAGTTAWSNYTTATPLFDLKNAVLFRRGHSVDFSGGWAIMNATQANYLTLNQNSADLFGRRTTGLATVNTIKALNEQILDAGDGLPQVLVYDKGFLDDSGRYNLFIPTGTVLLVGRRETGEAPGRTCYTRTMSNEPAGKPGPYAFVTDTQEKTGRPPRGIEVHRGFNFGPKVIYPSCFVTIAA